jgi:hypothetical protein
MFPLFTDLLPANASELQRLLHQGLERLFSGLREPVAVADKSYPNLASITIKLDRAQLRPDPPPPPSVSGKASPAFIVDRLQLSGADISAGPAALSLRLDARAVELQQGRDANRNVVLLVHRAEDGEVEVSAEKREIENAIAAVATREAGKHGVAIDQVQLSLNVRGERSVDAEVRLRARKLFFSTVVRIGAKLDLDEQLNARLSGLACTGEGAIGALACGGLQPHLQKLDGRSISLMALPLGEVRLRDVRLSAGDKITVRAQFGC